MIGIYVDNYLVIGKGYRVDKLIIDLKKCGFNLKVKNNLTDELSYQLTENAESKEILILQPHLINNLESKSGGEVNSKRVYKIFCPENDEEMIELN
jgi:hypothetical protein